MSRRRVVHRPAQSIQYTQASFATLYSVSQNFLLPQGFFVNISPTTEDFKIKLYTSILCSYLWKITNFYSIQL